MQNGKWRVFKGTDKHYTWEAHEPECEDNYRHFGVGDSRCDAFPGPDAFRDAVNYATKDGKYL